MKFVQKQKMLELVDQEISQQTNKLESIKRIIGSAVKIRNEATEQEDKAREEHAVVHDAIKKLEALKLEIEESE